MTSARGLVWSMNCESWLVPKNELMTDESVLELMRSTGLNCSLSLTFIFSRIVLAILERPTLNWLASCSPTVLTLRLLRWSMSSTEALELISWMRYLIISMMSVLVRTRRAGSIVRLSFLLRRYLPTIPRSYLFSEKKSLSMTSLAVASSGGSELRSCL